MNALFDFQKRKLQAKIIHDRELKETNDEAGELFCDSQPIYTFFTGAQMNRGSSIDQLIGGEKKETKSFFLFFLFFTLIGG